MLKSKRKTILILVLTLTLALATALCVGCAENEVEKELKLDKYSVVLQTEIFTEAEILAESNYDVEWSSSDETVVKVIGGRLKMQGLGQATITAKSNGQTKTCSVEVKEFLPKIELSEEEVSVKQTKTEKVSAIVKSHGEIVPGVIFEWESNDEEKVSVNQGLLSAKKTIGSAVVKASATVLGQELFAELTVNVVEYVTTVKFQRYVPNTGSDAETVPFVKDGGVESFTCTPFDENITEYLWAYNGMVLSTNQNVIMQGDSGEFLGWEFEEDKVLDAYYIPAPMVENSKGKMFLSYVDGIHTGSNSVVANKCANDGNYKDVYELSYGKKEVQYFIGVGTNDVSDYKWFSFNIMWEETCNAVLSVNGILASLHIESDVKKITNSGVVVKIYDSEMNEVSIADQSNEWYTIKIGLDKITDFDGGAIDGLALGLRADVGGKIKLANVKMYTPIEVDYTVQHYLKGANGEYSIDANATQTLKGEPETKVSATPLAYESHIFNAEVNDNIVSGIVSKDLVLKLYYDPAIGVNDTDGKAYINATTTSGVYDANTTIEKVDGFGGVQNVYKVTQVENNKNALLLTGVNPTTITEEKYKYLSFYLYVDFEDSLTFNYKITLTNTAQYGTKENALRITDISVVADYVTVTDLQGNSVSSVARKTWVNVLIDISKLNGKSGEFNCAYLQMGLQATGGHSYGTYYIGDAKMIVGANYTVESYFNDGTGNYVKNADAEILTAQVGAEVSCSYAYYNGYNPNYTAEGTKLSGVVSADGSLVLKMYYDNAIAIANSDGKAFFNAVNTSYAYTTGAHVERVGTMFEKDDVYKVTEDVRRTWIRVCGVQPSDVNTTYKTLKFNMYVDLESVSTYNIVLNTYANNGSSTLGSMHLTGDMSKSTNIKLYNAEGVQINNISGKQWITVVLDLSNAYGKTNYIHLELGANAGAAWYMQGATFSTDAF